MKQFSRLGIDLRIIGLGTLGILLVFATGVSKLLGINIISSAFVIGALLLLALVIFIWRKPVKTLLQNSPGSLILGEYEKESYLSAIEPFVLEPSKIRHVLVTGVTGSGKSTFIRRYIDEILRTDKRFLYVDFKGERKDHEEILEICERRGIRKELQIFDLADPATCLSCNLLTLFPQIEETVGFIIGLFFDEKANEYYKNEAERFLRYSLQLLDSSKTTRSFVRVNDIFYHETTRNLLLSKAKKEVKASEPFILYFESEFSKLSDRDRSERFSGFISLLSSFTSEPLRRIFNGEGTSEFKLNQIFNENIPVIIRVPGESYGELSARIVQSFIKSIPILLAQRRQQKERKDYFILLDEGCSYVNETLSDLCKKAGSAGIKLLLTRMSDADFDSVAPAFRGKMLSAFSVFVCFQTMDPDTRETMSRLSMTMDDIKLTKKVASGQDTGEGSLRDVQRFTIHPSSFGRLRVGECFVIAPSLNVFKKAKIIPVRSSYEKSI